MLEFTSAARYATFCFLIIMMSGCKGCESIDGTSIDLCESRNCRPGATCQGDRCECDDPTLVVGPQFCANPQYSDTWITFDVTPLSDTMLVAFNGEEWRDIDWDALPDNQQATSIPGKSYSRAGSNSLGTGITLTRSKRIPDTLGMYPIMRKTIRYHFIEDCCSCLALFKGSLVDENTIKGYVTTTSCSNPGEDGFPPEKYARYPMTWHRLN